MSSTRNPTAIASKTYRKVNTRLAKTIRTRVRHSKYPSEDFQDLLDSIDEKSKARALKWYERGIKRGLAFAVDKLLDGTIRMRRREIASPEEFVVGVRLRFRDEPWQKRKFKIKTEEVGIRHP